MERLATRLEEGIKDATGTLGDKILRVEAKGDARHKEQTERHAEDSARFETMEGNQRELKQLVNSSFRNTERRLEALENKATVEVPQAAQEAVGEMKAEQRTQSHRVAGLVILGVPLSGMVGAVLTQLFLHPDKVGFWLKWIGAMMTHTPLPTS